MAVLVAVLTFLVVTALLLGILLFTRRDAGEEIVRRRLDAVRKVERREGSSPELKLIRDDLLSDIPTLHSLLVRSSRMLRFREFLAQGGLKARPAKVILISAVLAAVGYLAVRMLLHSPMLGVAAACIAGVIPFAFVAIKRHRRLRAFERNFPEALDLLGRAVRAGHAFSTGLEMIADELPDPVSTEFRTTFEEQNFGLPFRDALVNLSERVPLLDVRFFVTAILIQKETGGNLAEILDTLARVIRDRFRIYREVRVRTAQGRMSAAILIGLPPSMMTAIGVINPTYIRVMFTDPWGPYALITAAVLQVVGAAILWKIVNIEV